MLVLVARLEALDLASHLCLLMFGLCGLELLQFLTHRSHLLLQPFLQLDLRIRRQWPSIGVELRRAWCKSTQVYAVLLRKSRELLELLLRVAKCERLMGSSEVLHQLFRLDAIPR